MAGVRVEAVDALAARCADRLFLGTSGVRPDAQVLNTTAVEVPVK
ncbi:hypothetical protein [Streptomyces sp. MBT97]